jgi:hypothetical protein
MTQTHAYCATCREESAITWERECLWCGNPIQGKGKKRGKPVGKYARLTEAQIRELYDWHLRGVSIRELGRRIEKRVGFASAKSAAMAISSGFTRYHLEARPQGEATAAKNRQRRSASSPGTQDRAAYKRWLLEKAGGRRVCEGVKLTYPEKGRPCRRWAQEGSDFCLQHDPERRSEVVATVERARAAA